MKHGVQPPISAVGGCIKHFKHDYNPHDDMNQMAEVVEKLVNSKSAPVMYAMASTILVRQEGAFDIKQAFRDFIISTMDKDDG